MGQIANELNISSSGLSLDHGWVRALAARTSGTIGFNNLQGKSGQVNGGYATSSANNVNVITLGGPSFFNDTLNYMSMDFGNHYTNLLTNGPNCTWFGAVTIYNNSSGHSIRLPNVGNGNWLLSATDFNVFRTGASNDSFTILPTA
jgi:hypothetical protein